MALSEHECAEAYEWIVTQLASAGAGDLVREVEAIVRAGTTASEEAERKQVTLRVPLSSRERLTVTLRLLIATASVPLMLQTVSDVVEPRASMLRWASDYVSTDEASPPGVEGHESPRSLTELRALELAVQALAPFLADLGAER